MYKMKIYSHCLYKLVGALLAGSFLLFSSSANSSDWICSDINDWSNSNCWIPGLVPDTGDSANILMNSASNITINYVGDVNPTAQLGDFFMGNSGAGTAILNQDTNLSLNAGLIILGKSDGSALVNHSAGDTFADYMLMGEYEASNAVYNLSGTATVNASTGIWIGGDGEGVLNQTGGVLSAPELTLGSGETGYGQYHLSAGQLTVDTEYVGFFGNALFTQSGGLHDVTNLHVGRKTGAALYMLDGGSLTVSNQLEVGTIPALPGSTTQDAVFEQNAGTVTVTGTGGDEHIRVSASGMANGRYDLNGGTLNAPVVINNDTFRYSGGVLNADVENHDTMILRGSGTRTINGDLVNVGQSYFAHAFNAGTVDEFLIDRTANGMIMLEDGTLVEVQGDLDLQTGGTLALDLGSGYYNSVSPWINVLGTASVSGVLDLSLFEGFDLMAGGTWSLLEASLVEGTFDELLFPVLPNWSWELLYGIDYIELTGSVSAVPVPAAIWLFGSGLIGLIAVSRRRS